MSERVPRPTGKRVGFISLGCSKNLLDTEVMLGHLSRDDWTFVQDPSEADVIVVNTCSFIEDAADESIDMILELAQYKQVGSCKRLVVAGCLPERYREEIADQMPEVDKFIGTGAYDQIGGAVEGSKDRGGCCRRAQGCRGCGFDLLQRSEPRLGTLIAAFRFLMHEFFEKAHEAA